MEEREYQRLADEAFRRIEDGFRDVDPEVVDCERTQGDVLTLTFASGARCVINTQRPTRQIWVAANARAWHFTFAEAKGLWVDEKNAGNELYATLQKIVSDAASLEIRI